MVWGSMMETADQTIALAIPLAQYVTEKREVDLVRSGFATADDARALTCPLSGATRILLSRR